MNVITYTSHTIRVFIHSEALLVFKLSNKIMLYPLKCLPNPKRLHSV